ncbi:TEAD [Mytilus edulis]|uniref:TEAD n=1 Tax=Mytilus edulis TaxID=6550 RepID=A0A8S3VHZ1_MYTED|nr:TEAD [Mytilus edulis]
MMKRYLYVAMTNEQSDSILNMPLDTLEQATSVLEQVHVFLNDAAATCASNKPRYNAKPKLNVWSPDIKLALDEMRKYYAQWVKQGKIKDPENNIYQQRLRTKKEFRRQVRIENAKVKNTEKQRIMETRTKDTKLFHQLVKSNRKTRGNAIMDLHVGDICMSGEQNVMEGFKQHFRNLATPEESTVLENRKYNQQVEY